MNRKSLRFRMTTWYSFGLFISLSIIFISFYITTKQTLFNYTDSILSSHASKVIEIIKKQRIGMHQYLADQGFLQEFSAIPGMLVVIIDDSGEIVNGTIGIDPQDLIFKNLFNKALNTRKPFFVNQNINNSTMRFLVSSIDENNKLIAVTLIAHPIDAIQESLNRLLIILGIVFTVLSGLTIIGGYFLTIVSLKPITTISSKLRKVEMENLKERVTNPQTGDEIEELILTFNSLLDRLEMVIERERQFIGSVAHELKTPLAILKSNIEITLLKKRSSKEYKETFSESLAEINRSSKKLNDILTLAWSKSENINTQGKIFDLSELVEEIRDIAKNMSLHKKITVNTYITGDIQVFGKRSQIARAILNIIDNAVKFTPNHGHISIVLQKHKNITFKIQDNGVGINSKDLPHIFESFYRGDLSDKTKGSGLGLTITLAIINAHHGTINAISKLSKGTTITIVLPKPKTLI